MFVYTEHSNTLTILITLKFYNSRYDAKIFDLLHVTLTAGFSAFEQVGSFQEKFTDRPCLVKYRAACNSLIGISDRDYVRREKHEDYFAINIGSLSFFVAGAARITRELSSARARPAH